jgi:hypothetical protein
VTRRTEDIALYVVIAAVIVTCCWIGAGRADGSVGGVGSDVEPGPGGLSEDGPIPPADTYAVDGSSVTEVEAYLEHLYQVETFLRWHSVWRWESTGLIDCESGGDWSINTGNGFYGGAQMSMRFWRTYGGLDLAARPDLAEPWQQVVVLDRWADSGGRFRQAFPACARRLGLR